MRREVDLARCVQFCKDVLFPQLCASCGVGGVVLCASCTSRFRVQRQQHCVFCGIHSVGGVTCTICKNTHALDGVVSALAYHQKEVRSAIRQWKYHFQYEVGASLGSYLIIALDASFWVRVGGHQQCVMLPIPLSPFRMRFRGFNQAEQLAESVHIAFQDVCLSRVLQRRGLHRSQAHKTHEKRKKMRNPFRIDEKEILSGKTVLLIDDVVTTGTTLEHAAAVCKDAGAQKVWGVVLAQGSFKNR